MFNIIGWFSSRERIKYIDGVKHSTVRYPDGTFPDGKPKPPRGYRQGFGPKWYEVPSDD